MAQQKCCVTGFRVMGTPLVGRLPERRCLVTPGEVLTVGKRVATWIAAVARAAQPRHRNFEGLIGGERLRLHALNLRREIQSTIAPWYGVFGRAFTPRLATSTLPTRSDGTFVIWTHGAAREETAGDNQERCACDFPFASAGKGRHVYLPHYFFSPCDGLRLGVTAHSVTTGVHWQERRALVFAAVFT